MPIFFIGYDAGGGTLNFIIAKYALQQGEVVVVGWIFGFIMFMLFYFLL